MLKYGLCIWSFLWIGGILLLFFPKKPGKLRQRLEGFRVETRNKIGKTNFFQGENTKRWIEKLEKIYHF